MSSLFQYTERKASNQPYRRFYRPGDRLPFVGMRDPSLREDEYEEFRVVTKDAHVKLLNLADPEQLRQYEEIWDHHLNGDYRIIHCERHYENASRIIVWVEYAVLQYEVPRKVYR